MTRRCETCRACLCTKEHSGLASFVPVAKFRLCNGVHYHATFPGLISCSYCMYAYHDEDFWNFEQQWCGDYRPFE